jgi:hypothetical protein
LIQSAEFVKPAPRCSDYFERRYPAEDVDAGKPGVELDIRQHFLSFLLWMGIR